MGGGATSRGYRPFDDPVGGGSPPIPHHPWRELLGVEEGNVRTNIVRVESDPLLFKLGDATARLWNELNYKKRRLFFKGELTPERMREVNRKYYHVYKGVLKVNSGLVARRNDQAWMSFFKLLKLKKEGKLPPFTRKVSPPGYWKDRVLGRRRLVVIIRSDRYYIERIEENWGHIVLKDYNKKIKYYGKLMWGGKQGNLEIVYDGRGWQAHITVKVGEKPPKSKKKGYIEGVKEVKMRGQVVKRNPESIKQRDPKGNNVAWIDYGLNNIFSVIISTGIGLLIKGGVVKSEHFYWKKEKSTIQSIRDKLRNLGLGTWIKYHHILGRIEVKAYRRIKHLYRTAIRSLTELLWDHGVSTVYMGYPMYISQDSGNEYNTNIWWYRRIARWLGETLEEYGIELYLMPEPYTSTECSICGEIHNNGRVHRGLYVCRRTGKKLNADLNAANNMAKRMGYKVEIKKILSYTVTHNGLKPITPKRGVTPKTPAVWKPRPSKGREGS